MEDRTRRRRWSGRNDGDTGWVEHRVAKTRGELFIQNTQLSFPYNRFPFKGEEDRNLTRRDVSRIERKLLRFLYLLVI